MRYHLFDAFEIELELPLVDSDLYLHAVAPEIVENYYCTSPNLSWSYSSSNEQLILQTKNSVTDFRGLATLFADELISMRDFLQPLALQLMPLHANTCLRLRLPYANFDEYTRLRTALDLVLPLMPGFHTSSSSQRAVTLLEGEEFLEIVIPQLQESIYTDIAVSALVVETLKALIKETWSEFREQRQVTGNELFALSERVCAEGDVAIITSASYLASFGISRAICVNDLWVHLMESLMSLNSTHFEFTDPLRCLLLSGHESLHVAPWTKTPVLTASGVASSVNVL